MTTRQMITKTIAYRIKREFPDGFRANDTQWAFKVADILDGWSKYAAAETAEYIDQVSERQFSRLWRVVRSEYERITR